MPLWDFEANEELYVSLETKRDVGLGVSIVSCSVINVWHRLIRPGLAAQSQGLGYLKTE